MSWTEYHSKLAAYELTRKFPIDDDQRLSRALVDAQVELNPHQVDAALFAFQSPLNKGAILADEVGLGKTIEAGLVISQKWAERNRKILIVVPSNLRKQWYQELSEKFFLPCTILESKSYKSYWKEESRSPFVSNNVIICSYQFARNKAEEVKVVPWDLVIFDEAHRLRNVYKPTNKISNELKTIFRDVPKLLLTAIPLQNSLLELYGLVSFVDDQVFGSLDSFRDQFNNASGEFILTALKARISSVIKRTLRRQVLPYISYTNRLPILQSFIPEESEDRLYKLVSEYLQRSNLYALPTSQRALMILVIRKLLASSSFAIGGTLETLIQRLELRIKDSEVEKAEALDKIGDDFETLEETREEWGDLETDEPLRGEDVEAIKLEIEDLQKFKNLALSIRENAKGKALLIALEKAFYQIEVIGAEKKAIIFTESRRTQDYLIRILSDSPWKDGLFLFNGSNNDDRSKQIYVNWINRHKDTDKVTGSKTADMRSALVDYFREEGQIMIATEAGAEGINLQFCSLIVNYDLPWNPQRIEQRIGRCHRYGQKHDVVVVNFLNETNEADQRVYQLLSEKFRLFEGVFGASDEILGSIESGVDFEKRIVSIYQNSRKSEEIQSAFDALQAEMGLEIDSQLQNTRAKLLENFDDEVREKLKFRHSASQENRTNFENKLMKFTRFELEGIAEFPTDFSFILRERKIEGEYPIGLYELPRRSGDAHLYRVGHPLADFLLRRSKERVLPNAVVEFDLSGYEGKITILDNLLGKSGVLQVTLITASSLTQEEEYLIFTGMTKDGQYLDEEEIARLFSINGRILPEISPNLKDSEQMSMILLEKESLVRSRVSKRNIIYFEEQAEKLDGWAEDLKLGLEREIKDIDRKMRETRRSSIAAPTLSEKLHFQKEIKTLEEIRSQKRKTLFDAQDDIDRRRGEFIAEIEKKLSVSYSRQPIFKIEWRVV
ncbi:DEAD/DEAH box helicase [Leptospira fluminis]|uniref:DEAD/DEAH box helicase n=1 Tax=Leptospira fluminis TaxID=2484979 RepID=A0A4R9GLQ2_9LEPT|nr:SNF2-related protein [Leptospira fluminis]TGK15728.1 DEAD/DEAH box helicase [Leptospira fluminis]